MLLQHHNSMQFPVEFYSYVESCQKERRYSTIEQECLAIVWPILKLQVYLCDGDFI